MMSARNFAIMVFGPVLIFMALFAFLASRSPNGYALGDTVCSRIDGQRMVVTSWLDRDPADQDEDRIGPDGEQPSNTDKAI